MIEIRPVDLANIDKHYAWNNDPELNYFDSDFPFIKESFESFRQRLHEMDSDNESNVKILEIALKDSGQLIGIVDIHGIDYINRRCFIECSIAEREYRNQGLGTMAFRETVRFCFEEMAMNKVLSSAFDFNEKWIRILNNLGFEQEGRLREHAIKNGSYSDKLIFGLLAHEYKESHQFHEAV